MSVNMAPGLRKELASKPDMLHWRDDRGWGLLHIHALAGNADIVQVLLDAGVDPNLKTKHGATPLQLAHVLGWEKVVAQLMARGARG
ncbi:ankyrin repeat domain-containing protein [Anatilimnocola floriformis]|uniref:ankyrin repeat domain-containing protein n=1 Tax=Anatilimnocola floriformis TaxID=2948575 RepID=UPI0020C1CC84|nr:ankyrin repeat domain-containing protein [Anatilimnocola floriformis]